MLDFFYNFFPANRLDGTVFRLILQVHFWIFVASVWIGQHEMNSIGKQTQTLVSMLDWNKCFLGNMANMSMATYTTATSPHVMTFDSV